MTTQILAIIEHEDEMHIKLSNAIGEVLHGMSNINPYSEDSLNEAKDPEFIVIRIDSYNIKQLEYLEKERPNSLTYWEDAIKFFRKRTNKTN